MFLSEWGFDLDSHMQHYTGRLRAERKIRRKMMEIRYGKGTPTSLSKLAAADDRQSMDTLKNVLRHYMIERGRGVRWPRYFFAEYVDPDNWQDVIGDPLVAFEENVRQWSHMDAAKTERNRREDADHWMWTGPIGDTLMSISSLHKLS